MSGLYIILTIIFAGIFHYIMPKFDDNDVVDTMVAVLAGCIWPVAIVIGIVWFVFWLLSFVVTRISKICALVHGFIHSIRRKNGENN